MALKCTYFSFCACVLKAGVFDHDAYRIACIIVKKFAEEKSAVIIKYICTSELIRCDDASV